MTGQIGSKANRFNIIYSDPHFLDSDFLFETRGYRTDVRYQSNQGFNTSATGGVFSVGHLLFERVFGGLAYTIEEVTISDVAPTAPINIQRQAAESGGKSTTSAVTGSVVRDSRDSITEPTRGNRTRLAATYAGGALGADNNFTKSAFETSQYWPLWWKFVGNIRGTLWYGEAFGETPLLPVQERFFLGGPNTLRGFRNFTVSPKDAAGGLTGGNKAYFVNTELIFPLYEAMRLRGLVFFDVGNNSGRAG